MNKTHPVNPADFEVERQGNDYVLCHEGQPLETPTGIPLVSGKADLLEYMIHEFRQYPEIGLEEGKIRGRFSLCAYMLFAAQKDFIERGKKFSREEYLKLLKTDPIFHPAAGPDAAGQYRAWKAARSLLHELGMDYALLEESEDPFAPFRTVDVSGDLYFAILIDELMKLTAPQKAVLIYLYRLHYGNIVYPLLLIRGRCEPAEYAGAVLAGKGEQLTAGGGEDPEETIEKIQRELFRRVRGNARTCLEYLSFFDEKGELERIIQEGESERVEFKSSLRWNIKAGKNDDSITHACLKTLNAFLNTDGGVLLIGVADNGEVPGIELDRFPNEDRFLLHLFNVIKSSMGEPVAALIRADMIHTGEQTACMATCEPSPFPVFLKFKKNQDEEFYIRTGPGSTRLSPAKLMSYIMERFPGSKNP